jgi:DNA-binding MurR/RpiR family transcriptional regulator
MSPSNQTLSCYITNRFHEFSRSQRDVARYIVDHLDETAFLTAEELARQANTSSSTVVRFSQTLGFEGYPELQQAVREEYRRRPVDGNDVPATAPLFPFDPSEVEMALSADFQNIEKTARRIERSEIESAVAAIADADKVIVVGTDQMAFFASYMRHLLVLLDLRADLVASPSQEGLGRLARIDAQTVVVVMSAGRTHPLLTRAVKLACHRKAATVAISDATLSDVTRLARISLYYSSNTPAHVRSHTALLSIIQALAFGVYARDSSQYEDRIKAYRLK